MKVGFIGTGNMGGALAHAAAQSPAPAELLLSNRTPEKAQALAQQLGATVSDNETIAQTCDYIFLGVKPQMMAGMLAQIAPILRERGSGFVLVSMAAGLTTGQILDIEDFLVSNLLLPIGSLIYLLFCVSKWGWGFDKYLAEANKGTGLGMSPRFKIYFQFILPMLILVILLVGLGSWGWRALICAAVAVFVWFMARRSSSKSTI